VDLAQTFELHAAGKQGLSVRRENLKKLTKPLIKLRGEVKARLVFELRSRNSKKLVTKAVVGIHVLLTRSLFGVGYRS
jgi:hypothetical protein